MQNLPEIKCLETIYKFSYIDEEQGKLTTSLSNLALLSSSLSTNSLLAPFGINQDEDRVPTLNIKNPTEKSGDLEANRNCLSRIESTKAWKYTKNFLSVLEEFFETGSISYATWILYTYNPSHLSKINFAFIGGGGALGSFMEILEISRFIKPKNYETYRNIKEALAGAAAAANFLQGFMQPNNTAVAVGIATFALLTLAKSGLNFYQKRDFFRTCTGKLIKYSTDGTYYLLAGAGICAYLFSIVNGFGKNPNGFIVWGVTAALSGTNLLANAIKKHNSNALTITPGLILVGLVCAVMYGFENALFTMLMLLDIVSDIVSTDLSDQTFYIILGVTIATCIIVTLKKLYNDLRDNKREHCEEVDEHTPLHAAIANHGKVEELEEVEHHRDKGCIANESSSQWSNSLCFLRSHHEQARGRCSWVKNLTNCWQPSSDPLLQEVKLYSIN